MKMTKIYTRTGDKGTTSLVGGVRIKKSDARIEAYGTIDELSSHLGLLVSMLVPDYSERELLLRIQHCLFVIGSHLATDQSQTMLPHYAQLSEDEVGILEERIDQILSMVPETSGFVLPGGTMAAAQCHVCRTVCRRAERCIVALSEEATVSPEVQQYINRLSDYLFVLAKKLNFLVGKQEKVWQNVCK